MRGPYFCSRPGRSSGSCHHASTCGSESHCRSSGKSDLSSARNETKSIEASSEIGGSIAGGRGQPKLTQGVEHRVQSDRSEAIQHIHLIISGPISDGCHSRCSSVTAYDRPDAAPRHRLLSGLLYLS